MTVSLRDILYMFQVLDHAVRAARSGALICSSPRGMLLSFNGMWLNISITVLLAC